MNEIAQNIYDEIHALATLYRKKAGYKRNKGWKAKRYRAVAFGLEKAAQLVKTYGTPEDYE